MGKRVIVGLKWAKRLEGKPKAIPEERSRGNKALGIRSERDLSEAYDSLAEGKGVWFEFEDKNGHGYCQVDFLLDNPLQEMAFVLEAKHTWTEDAGIELEKLYLPVVKMAMEYNEVKGIVVCKNLLPYMKNIFIVSTLKDAILHAGRGKNVVWHWISPAIIRPWRGGGKSGHGAKRRKAVAKGPFTAYA